MSTALKFGKYYRDVSLPEVPRAYLEFLLAKPDLWPETRAQIDGELKRRAAQAPAQAEVAEPLDARLRGDEERVVATRCPRCGHDVDCVVRLVRK